MSTIGYQLAFDQLLAASKEAIKCIARLTPFPTDNLPADIKTAVQQTGDYADTVRDQLRQAITNAEDITQLRNAKQLLKPKEFAGLSPYPASLLAQPLLIRLDQPPQHVQPIWPSLWPQPLNVVGVWQ